MEIFKAIGKVLDDVVEVIDSKNKIHVHLNRYSYVGGEMVEGSVLMSCLVRD